MNWFGDWIWTDSEATPRNAYAYFRRDISLTHVPQKAVARLTADSRYVFWINGQFICRGPSRCDPRWQSYDELDIAPFLREGRNTLAVLAHHYGESTFSYILGRAGFLFECSAVNVWSDATWKALESPAWFRDLTRMSVQTGFPEVFDARRDPIGWTGPDFDDSKWPPAVVVGKPPCEPWFGFEPREIPFLRDTETGGAQVIASGETESLHPVEVLDLQRFFQTDQFMTSWQVAYACIGIRSDEAQDIRLELITAQALKLWVNGEVVTPGLINSRKMVEAPLRAGWNWLVLKLLQGQHQWKAVVRFVGAADKLPRAWQAPESGSAALPGWAVSGPYTLDGVRDQQAALDTPLPPESDGGSGMKAWQRLTETRGQGQFGGGSERAVALLLDYTKHRPGLPLQENFPAELGDGQYLVVDFGREVAGYPRLQLRAPAGAILDIGYGERLLDGVVRPNRHELACADRLVTRSGAQAWEPFEKRAFRYVQIDCRHASSAVHLDQLSVNVSTYPVEERGRFECSDLLLNRIWQTGADTVRLNMEDAYTDCPARGRAMDWTSVNVGFLVNSVAFGDAALARRGLRLVAQSQDADGRVCGIYPAACPDRHMPSASLLWIHSLWDYYWNTGDTELVRELYPKVQNALKWFARYVSPNKLLAGTPGWAFIDWAPLDQRGEQAALNALYARALEVAGSLSEIVNARPLAIRYRALAREVKAAFHRQFWNAARETYVDCRVGDEPSAVASQHTNAFAVFFGIAPSQLYRTTLGSVCCADPAMDPEDVVACASPYASFYLLGALHAAGLHTFALDYLRARWKRMLDAGATTGWELWNSEGSWCHGWSAGPTYLLTTHILGVRPTAPGWRSFEVHPQPCGLKWAQGTVPTPLGDIAVEWRIEDGRCTTAVRAPAGAKHRVIEPEQVV
ncbi:MAG: family 78 glycoside hydrolase catalytic domain [Verrucomicrobia bacterium]|nr:family 78 glycoside hydrolase catalytic domain [Verrucomicrobiota bacterium]